MNEEETSNREAIDALLEVYDIEGPSRWYSARVRNEAIGLIRPFLEQYVRNTGRLPTGKHDLGSSPHGKTVDFDKLHAAVKTKAEILARAAEEERYIDYCQTCPFCGSNEACEHMLASIDYSSQEILGGFLYDNEALVLDLIEGAFIAAASSKGTPPSFRKSKELMKLWTASEIEMDEDDDEPCVNFPSEIYRFVSMRLQQAGAVGNDYQLDTQPGCSSEMCDLFSEDPEQVIKQYRLNLTKELGIAAE